MNGKVSERVLSPNLRRRLDLIEGEIENINSELKPEPSKTVPLNHGVNIVESETNTLMNMPYIKGNTVYPEYAPDYDPSVWTIEGDVTIESSTLSTMTSGDARLYCFLNLKGSTEFELSVSVSSTGRTGQVNVISGHDINLSNRINRAAFRQAEMTDYSFTFMAPDDGKVTVLFNTNGRTTDNVLGKLSIHEVGQNTVGFKSITNPMIAATNKNLLPPFTEWTLHDNAKLISPYELELNAKGSTQSTSCFVEVEANTTYTFNFNGNGRVSIMRVPDSSNSVDVFSSDTPVSFNTENNTTLLVICDNGFDFSTEKFTWSSLQLELGFQATEFEPQKQSQMYFPNMVLASNIDGSVCDELLPSGEVMKRFEQVTLNGSFEFMLEHSIVTNLKKIEIKNVLDTLRFEESEEFLIVSKYDGKILANVLPENGTTGDKVFMLDGYTYISVDNNDSGWGDNYTPTADEIKAYFNGWKLFIKGQNKRSIYNGVGEKQWVKITRINDNYSLTGDHRDTVPTEFASIDNQGNTFTPYKIQYQLREPRIENVNSIGRIQIYKYTNYIKVGEGFVVREKANPYPSNNLYYINGLYDKYMLKHKVSRILKIHKGNVDDTHNWTIVSGDLAYPVDHIYARSVEGTYDPTATYYVDYMSEYTAQVKDVLASYPVSMASKVDQYGELINQLGDHLGTSEKRIEEVRNESMERIERVCDELFTSVDNGKWDMRSAIIGKGGSVSGTHPNSFAELVSGVNNVPQTAIVANTTISTTTIAANTTATTISQTLASDAVILFGFNVRYLSSGSSTTVNGMVNCSVSPTGAVTFSRTSSSAHVIDIYYQIVRFRNVNRVIRNNTVISSASLSSSNFDITLPQSVNRVRSFVFATLTPVTTSYSLDARQFHYAYLTSNTNLRLRFGAPSAVTLEWNVNYQIVELL